MELTVNRRALQEAIDAAKGVASPKSTLEILRTVCVSCDDDILSITATDVERFVSVQVVAENIVSPGGAFCVDAMVLASWLNACGEDTVTVRTDETEALFVCGSSRATFQTMDADDFPQMPEFAGEMQPLCETFYEDVQRIILAACTDELTRPILNSVHFDEGFVVATDTHRMHVIESPEIQTQCNVPLATMRLLPEDVTKMAIVQDGDEVNSVVFRSDRVTLWSRVNEGSFPNWRKIIDDGTFEHGIEFDKSEMLDMLKRVRSVKPVADKFIIDWSNGRIFADGEIADCDDEIALDGKAEVKQGFNVKYFIDAVSACDCETAQAWVNEAKDPVLVTDAKRFRAVLMPMTVD